MTDKHSTNDETVTSAYEEEVKKWVLPKKFRANWRLTQLSKQVPRLARDKYVPVDEPDQAYVSPAALRAECTMRSDHMARPPVRLLEENKSIFGSLKGDKYVKRMDHKIECSWNSIYNYYKKAEMDLKKTKKAAAMAKIPQKPSKKSLSSKKSKASSKKSSVDSVAKSLDEWCSLRAKPKVVHSPPPIDRGKRLADLDSLKDRLTTFSTPKQVVPKYDPEEKFWQNPLAKKIKESTLTYEPTERILVLAKPLKMFVKPVEQPNIKPSALEYTATERLVQLAVPKKKSKGPESDIREDAFVISKGALKYIATPRILELARPIER